MARIILNLYSNNKGSLLFMSIIILTSILMAAFSAASLVMSGIVISGTEQRSTQAYFAAEAGIEKALYWARKSDTTYSDLSSDILNVVSGTLSNSAVYNVDYTTWSGGTVETLPSRTGGYVRNFTSAGELSGTRRTVEAQYGYVPEDRIVIRCSISHLDLCDNQVDCLATGGTWDADNNICS